MTEDRVPTPRMRVGINGRHIHPAGITDTEHCAECRLAMTEDRVPTHGVGFVDKVGIECLCGWTCFFDKGGWIAFNQHQAELPAPPLDVERLARALHVNEGDRSDYENCLQTLDGWHRKTADILAAEYARLGSAPSTPEARDD